MFLFGVVLAVLGVLFGLPDMRTRLGLTLVQQGDIIVALFFGVFISTVLAGPTIDSFGNKPVLRISATLVMIAFTLFANVHSFAAALVVASLLGFGAGGLNTSANALVAGIYPEKRAAMLNVVAAFYGIGALCVPLLATFTASSERILFSGSALAAICAIFYFFVSYPRPAEPPGFSLVASINAARIPGVLLFGIMLLCESGNESSIAGWTSTYAGSLGAPPRIATWVLFAYWIAFTLARFLAAKLVRFMTKPRLIVVSAIGSIAGAAVLLAAASVSVLTIGTVIIGVSFAAIYPTALAIVADRYARQAATIFGFLFAIGLGGGMLFPWLIGHLSQSASLRAGMIVPLAGAVVISIIAVVQSRSDA